MQCKTIHLKEEFPFLGQDGCDPTVEVALRYNMTEMKREQDKRPCMIVCPGGGYAMCSQREAEPIATKYFADGYNTFTLWYSVAPHRFPTQLREVAAVLELIYAHAEEWNCDVNRIAIIGFSAGGHLAAHYSNAYDWPEVREFFPESKPVGASVLCYPVISADPEHGHIGSFDNLLGDSVSGEDRRRFSCQNMVSDRTPPAFIWHTAEDNCVSVKNSLVYAEALSAHKIPFELRIYPFGWHGLATADGDTNDALEDEISRANDWIEASKGWLKLIFNKD